MRLDLLISHLVPFLQLLMAALGKEGRNYNIAVHKPANQSSTYDQAWAGLAVDGIGNSDYFSKSCAHTANCRGFFFFRKCTKAWWEVDLQKQCTIGNIRMLNRGDSDNGDRLHDVRVDVFQDVHQRHKGKHCNTHTGVAGPGWLNMTCASPVTGRYVRISKPQIKGSDVLTLCEVEIYEAPGHE